MAKHVVRNILSVTAIGLIALTGCSSGDDSSSGSSSDPIKVMTWAPLASPKVSAPQMKTTAEARVAAINAAGGINGRRVELVFCDTNYDPNTESGCARQAQEEGVVAVVAPYTTYPATYEFLDRAQIPVIGALGINPAEFTSEMTYPLSGGLPGWYAGAVSQAKDAGAKTIAMLACGSSACELASKIANDAVAESGLTLTESVTFATGSPDLSAPVAKAISANPDALILAVPPNDLPKAIQAVRNASYDGIISSVTGVFPPATIAALGESGNGILLASQVLPSSDPSNPTITQYLKEIDAVDPNTNKDENSQLAWGGYVLFETVAKRLDEVNRETLADAMKNLSDPVDTGITAPYSTTGTQQLPDYPRLFNPTVYYTQISDGKVVQMSPTYVNPFDSVK